MEVFMEKHVENRNNVLSLISAVILAVALLLEAIYTRLPWSFMDSLKSNPSLLLLFASLIILIVGFLLKRTALIAAIGFIVLSIYYGLNLFLGIRSLSSLTIIWLLFPIIGSLLAAVVCLLVNKKAYTPSKVDVLLGATLLVLFVAYFIIFYYRMREFVLWINWSQMITVNLLGVIGALLQLIGTTLGIASLTASDGKLKKTIVRSDGSMIEFNLGYFNLFIHILLILVTTGIWSVIWVYRTTRYTNQVKDLEKRIPIRKLLLCLFVPFYIIYWNYVTAKRIDMIAEENGVKTDAKIAVLCLVFSFLLNIAPPIIMQSRINKIAKSIR